VAALSVAAVAWVAGPFLVIVVNGFFVKIDPTITFSHCAGYLARFLIAGLAAGIALA
jgi:ACR3 family arsenite efflux pump ArsB